MKCATKIELVLYSSNANLLNALIKVNLIFFHINFCIYSMINSSDIFHDILTPCILTHSYIYKYTAQKEQNLNI